MKNWKKNAVVASILVFVCAGIYLNWLYTQDTETADLVDTLDQEKILGSSTLVMSQNDDLAADAAKEDLSDVSGEVTDYFAAVRLSRQESRDSAVSMLQEAMSYGEDAQSTSASQLHTKVMSSPAVIISRYSLWLISFFTKGESLSM